MDGGLIFAFADFITECETLKRYASGVLDKSTLGSLDQAKSTLENIQSKGSTKESRPWQISRERPLRTVVSQESQPDAKCKHDVYGEFSFVWKIRPLDEGKWRGRKYFILDDLASTLITIKEKTDEGDRAIAWWTSDVGDSRSPGTHFHFQMNHLEEPPFPKSLDVPRLPAPLMSPFLAMELAIGELFQDRWKKHALRPTNHSNTWRRIHQHRMMAFLLWQIDCIKKFNGSPWMALKLAKPRPELIAESAK